MIFGKVGDFFNRVMEGQQAHEEWKEGMLDEVFYGEQYKTPEEMTRELQLKGVSVPEGTKMNKEVYTELSKQARR